MKMFHKRRSLPTKSTGGASDTGNGIKPTKRAKAPVSATGTIVAGLCIVLITFFGAGVWAATAPLASAVSASGTVVFAGKRREIQHLEGGIVEKIHVQEGQKVVAGDILISLDEVRANATVGRLQTQYDSQLALKDRLATEQRGDAEVTFSPTLVERRDDIEVGLILSGQVQEFEERRRTLMVRLNFWARRYRSLNKLSKGCVRSGRRRLNRF